MAEKLLTVREVSHLLGLSEKEVIELSEQGKIPAYKIGGVYLRFKKEQIEKIKDTFKAKADLSGSQRYTLLERFTDFVYFNNFYILAAIIIAVLVVIIVKGMKG